MISFEDFERYLNSIQELFELQDNISRVISMYGKSKEEMIEISFPTLSTELIGALEKVFHDKNSWISYWIYELDFGNKYKEGSVIDADGSDIPLKTIEDLWNLLHMEE